MIRLFASAAILVLAACSPAGAPVPRAGETGPVLSYSDAFMMAPIGASTNTMGGVTLSVKGGELRLMGASSDAIGTIELHTMAMEDGKMRMRPVPDGFEISDGETLTLARGGHHFMMFDVAPSVASGETIDILLNFDAGGEPMTLVIEAQVKAVGE